MELPPYKQVYESLRQQITNETYQPGSLLPSENELCSIHEVARPTVRKALDQLVSDGFIIKRQGKGSIVKSIPKGIGILSITGTTSAVGKENIRTAILAKPVVMSWNEAFSYELTDEEKAARCIYFERLRYVNGEPLFLDITMLPDINLPRFTAHNLENVSLFDLLRTKYQITVTGGTQQLFAISADKRMAGYLGIKSGYPILQLNRKIDTSREGFHIYSQLFCVTKNYSITGNF